jgi:hypothetical protein
MCRKRKVRGSALILTVVLTSLLAIVGVLFLMITRVDRMATSATSQNKELDLAIDALIAKVSERLIWDVPGTRLAGGRYPEYHDYPGPDDRWLASSEPYQVGAGVTARYFWRHASDIYERFDPNAYDLLVAVVADYQDKSRMAQGLPADADGDGIADSLWVIVPGITTTKGRPVFAAVRIVDNGGTINVNTAFRFDPCDPDISRIDGTNLSQINLMALAGRPEGPDKPPPTPAEKRANEMALFVARANGVGLDPNNLAAYETNVIWHYEGELSQPYTPFDISDELELRNRFLLNQRDTDARIERFGWGATGSILALTTLDVPIGSASSGITVSEWFDRAFICDSFPVVRVRLDRYDYRHIASTYSMDRIINPVGVGPPLWNGKMVNVNTNTDWRGEPLRTAIKMGLWDADPNLGPVPVDALAAQITANIIDYRDDNSSVTRVVDINGAPHYGFERPCIYISEVAAAVKSVPPATYTSYAIELYKPYFEDDIPGPGTWRLMIDATPVTVTWTGIQRFHVVRFEDPCAPLGPVNFNDPDEALYAAAVPGYTPPKLPADANVQDVRGVAIGAGSTILLQRSAPGGFITVDSNSIPRATGVWLSPDGKPRSIQRDISLHKCIRRLWGTAAAPNDPNLGHLNTYVDSSALGRILVQAHPYLDPDPNAYGGRGFKNIGEIGMVFASSGYDVPAGSTEANLRLDFKNVLFARILNYLTVIDPADHGGRVWNETRIKGRINVNTAPPYVLEQLPWMAPVVSQAVVAYRDKIAIPGGPDYRARPGGLGFRSIGEVTWVPDMGYYAADGLDQRGFPDLSPLKLILPLDGAKDDFEERDLIFHRISNLVTVRSDVFTAYILVRIGADGPQRRMIAILDRSGVFPRSAAPYTSGKVKVRALHQVPDPW